ncbi:hypothetical protein RFI_29226 [Reticulomyxa filosa]|uniref:Uncharacterized protein n=1 Tax=Reticulomyxa filosa TaxID=46433 RepID=X6M548_RETFI|nr:hypothetical protein RFI_29226 [Reticulomyxa filosa]|eukprot:ETO08160.1 hypothetical protein RFI_29226 [Reticulomyxa filosa]
MKSNPCYNNQKLKRWLFSSLFLLLQLTTYCFYKYQVFFKRPVREYVEKKKKLNNTSLQYKVISQVVTFNVFCFIFITSFLIEAFYPKKKLDAHQRVFCFVKLLFNKNSYIITTKEVMLKQIDNVNNEDELSHAQKESARLLGGMQQEPTSKKYAREIRVLKRLCGDIIDEEALKKQMEESKGDISLVIENIISKVITQNKHIINIEKKKKDNNN